MSRRSKHQKLIVVLLRGGFDGLAAVMPQDDPDFTRKRGGLLVKSDRKLSGGFALHPRLKTFHRLYQAKQLSIMHAAALPNVTRSHFKAQDHLEFGNLDAGSRTGWLGRLIELSDEPLEAVSYGPVRPLILKGTDKSFCWTMPRLSRQDEKLMSLIKREIYTDHPQLRTVARELDRIDTLLESGRGGQAALHTEFDTVGRLMAHPDGPRIGVISLYNWDTHDDQLKRLDKELKTLDAGLASLVKHLGPDWKNTTVVFTSEFGRSLHQNGSKGTDHGTGGVCFVAGGRVDGGRMLGAWPGLEPKYLFENRDLYPANDVRTVFAHIAYRFFDLPNSAVRDTLFPDIAQKALSGVDF